MLPRLGNPAHKRRSPARAGSHPARAPAAAPARRNPPRFSSLDNRPATTGATAPTSPAHTDRIAATMAGTSSVPPTGKARGVSTSDRRGTRSSSGAAMSARAFDGPPSMEVDDVGDAAGPSGKRGHGRRASTAATTRTEHGLPTPMTPSNASSQPSIDSSTLRAADGGDGGSTLNLSSDEFDQIDDGAARDALRLLRAGGGDAMHYALRTHLQVVLPANPGAIRFFERFVRSPFVECMDNIEERVWAFSATQELDFLPMPNYLHRHPDLNPRIRYILVDWLFEVADEFLLQRETVYLAVNYVDRYLSFIENCPKESMQAIGVTCLFLAAKLEEVKPPLVHDYSRVTAGAHSSDDIRNLELTILDQLRWKMSPPTIHMWINLYLNNFARLQDQAAGAAAVPGYGLSFKPKFNPNAFSLAMTTADYCVHHEDSLRFSYSMIAASIVKLHQYDTDDAVSPVHGFARADLHECMAFVRPFLHLPRNFMPKTAPVPEAKIPASEWCFLQRHNKALLARLIAMQDGRPEPTLAGTATAFAPSASAAAHPRLR